DTYTTSAEFDLGALCNSVTCEQNDDAPRRWVVTCEYGPPTVEQGQQQENPLLRPAVLTWGFTQNSRAVWKDVNGTPIQNSAGDAFDPPPEIDDSRPVLTVTRNEAGFNPAIAIQYQDAVNSDQFLGFNAGVVKINGISSTSQSENGIAF